MATAASFITALRKQVGTKYTWGGKTPATGLDCSGLIHHALAEVGVSFVHGSSAQIAACTPISVEDAWGTPGALLWREGHDAISLGDGTAIEALTTTGVTITQRTDTYAGKPRFTKAGLIPGINHKQQEVFVTKFSSPVPVGSRFTSGFSFARTINGVTAAHLGDDFAPPKVGVSVPITAVADGTVTAVGTGVLEYHSGTIAVIDHGTLKDQYGSDRMITNYGHLKSASVKVGQKVKAGQVIGMMGATGNVTGMHLHGGVRCNGKWISFRDWLNRKGVFPGRTAPLTASTTAPAPKPSTPAPAKNTNSKSDNEAIQKALNAMGIDVGKADGVDGPKQKAGVKVFQRAHGLVPDGYWGPATQAKFVENRSVQNAIKRMKGVPDTWKSDGFIGATSKKWIEYTNKRQGWGSGSAVNSTLINNLKKVGAW